MLYCYLFEVKSIQSYLFKTGKLKDVIAASERLDLLIDDTPDSVLFHVLNVLSDEFSHDLMEPNVNKDIQFLRCKGGAFYAFSDSESPLIALRSLWTLTVSQLFPSLTFCDALVSAASLQEAMKLGHQTLSADRNQAKVQLPLAPAIAHLSQRTGNAAVPISAYERIGAKDEQERLDLDTKLHRQSYESMNLKQGGALQDKFTPSGQSIHYLYATDLETEFDYTREGNDYAGKRPDERKDIALIHIDGNGLGEILRVLNIALHGADKSQYARTLRNFSKSLALATQQAAQQATELMIEFAYGEENKILPMRPLVLGGDDVTLFVRADLALTWSEHFCKAFKALSEVHLEETIHDIKALLSEKGAQALEKSPKQEVGELKPYLTASGGILFQKSAHPFTHSHKLVEGLCKKAKGLTKQLDRTIGPAALSFIRLSNAAIQSLDKVLAQNFTYPVQELGNLQTRLNAYLVEPHDSAPSLQSLVSLFEVCSDPQVPMTMNKWRQVLSLLAIGDLAEAKRIIERDLRNHKFGNEQMLWDAFNGVHQRDERSWYWQSHPDNTSRWVTPLADLMLLERFYLKAKDTDKESA